MFQEGSKQFKWLFWGLSLLWMAVIFAFSSQANSGAYTETYLQDANVPVRKMAHMFEYAVLAVLFQTALSGRLTLAKLEKEDQQRAFKLYILAFVLAVLYALTDEWHQAFVPGRSSSLLDSGVDSIGALIGLGCAYGMRQFSGPRQR